MIVMLFALVLIVVWLLRSRRRKRGARSVPAASSPAVVHVVSPVDALRDRGVPGRWQGSRGSM